MPTSRKKRDPFKYVPLLVARCGPSLTNYKFAWSSKGGWITLCDNGSAVFTLMGLPGLGDGIVHARIVPAAQTKRGFRFRYYGDEESGYVTFDILSATIWLERPHLRLLRHLGLGPKPAVGKSALYRLIFGP